MKQLLTILLICLASCRLAGRDTDIVGAGPIRMNDPTSNNILAWMLGGSVLVTSISSTWYMRKRAKGCK